METFWQFKLPLLSEDEADSHSYVIENKKKTFIIEQEFR